MENKCGDGKRIGKARRVAGDILIALAVVFTVYLCVIMTHRINTVVLKANYLEGHPDAALILTGGNPDASGRTEAAVMRDVLLERGVPEEKLRLEDQAKTTKENFRDAARMIDPGEPVVLITSNYHMDRAVRTAKSAGFTDVLPLPAPSSALSFAANVLWKVVLELNELTLKH